MRSAIAAAMARSKREIPHYYLEHQVDVTACEQWLPAQTQRGRPTCRLLFGALAVKAVALAARRFPAFNGFYRDGRFEPSPAVHTGVAIAIRGGGLAAPALQDTDQLPLDELMSRLRDLVQRMRAGRVRSSEIADATITVSSLGERGVETLYGIIYPPRSRLSVRQARATALGDRGRRCAALRCHDHALGGPSGERWSRGRAVSCRDRQLLQEPDKL